VEDLLRDALSPGRTRSTDTPPSGTAVDLPDCQTTKRDVEITHTDLAYTVISINQ